MPAPTIARLIRSLAAAAALPIIISSTAFAQTLTIVSWGGSYQTSQREAYFKPFTERTGITIKEEEWDGDLAKIHAMVKAGVVPWDVIDLTSNLAVRGCREGVFVPLDYGRLLPRHRFQSGATYDCAVGTTAYATVLAYDSNKLKNGPTKIADLFDLRRFPGNRGLYKQPFGNLEFALLADGVPPSKVYPMLSTSEGIDRAFKRLDTIKGDVVWWDDGYQPERLLASGKVSITTVWSGLLETRRKPNLKIVWDGQIQDFDFWAIPKGTKKVAAAYRFLAFASDPKNMANQSRYISLGPVVTGAFSHVRSGISNDLPTASVNSTNVLTLNALFWADKGEELRKRFNAWIAK